MEVYFYCSYEHSQKGFFLTQLAGNALIPAETVPERVESFFSYDQFQVLWYDLCSPEAQTLWKPQPTGAFFGLRNLRGEMADGRAATINLAFLAAEEEMTWLRRIALTVLGDYPAFQRQLALWLCVGGASYALNVSAFSKWMEDCGEACRMERLAGPKARASSLLFWMQRTQAPKLENELLRLAVYTSNWKSVQSVMGGGVAWKLKHPCAITPEEFETVFIQEAPVWSLA